MNGSPQPAFLAVQRLRRVWLFVSLAWLGPAILAAFQAFVQGRLGHRAPATWRTLTWEGGDWLLYALLTPAVFWLARRYPLLGRGAIGRVPVHLCASVALCVAWAGGGVFLWRTLFSDPTTPWGAGVAGWFLTSLPFGVAVYFALLGVEHAAFYFFEARERAVHAAQLSSELTQARLDALRSQMRPHFLRNTLNAITTVVRDGDSKTATWMLEQLGELLRRVTRSEGPQEIPLAEELGFLRRFLAIEEVRFSDRLRPELDVPRELLDAAVPDLLLQPLVENALRHGLARRVTATRLRIEARREGDELVLTIIDDGPGPVDDADARSAGVGLANTRKRLATLYGDRARLDLTRLHGGGAAAIVRLPYRELAPSEGVPRA